MPIARRLTNGGRRSAQPASQPASKQASCLLQQHVARPASAPICCGSPAAQNQDQQAAVSRQAVEGEAASQQPAAALGRRNAPSALLLEQLLQACQLRGANQPAIVVDIELVVFDVVKPAAILAHTAVSGEQRGRDQWQQRRQQSAVSRERRGGPAEAQPGWLAVHSGSRCGFASRHTQSTRMHVYEAQQAGR